MEELIEQIVEKTGLQPEQAKIVAHITINFLRDKMPEPVAGLLNNFIGGEDGKEAAKADGGPADMLKDTIGNLFG